MKFSKEQIEEFKKKHGEVFRLELDWAGKSCLVRRPSRKDLSYVLSIKDPIRMSEVLLNTIWLAGDEEIKEKDELFLAILPKMDVVMEARESSIKKL